VYAAVSQLVESPLCVEAVSVLEAVLQSSSMHSEAPPTGSLQENGITNNVPRSSRRLEGSPQRILVPQSSLKLRNSGAPGQQPWAGSAGQVPSGTASPVAADILPSRSDDPTRLYLFSFLLYFSSVCTYTCYNSSWRSVTAEITVAFSDKFDS